MPDVQETLVRGPVIVIVDDEPSIRNGLSSLFEDATFDVHCAQTGREGLALVRSLTPDLVITDLMMPEMSGRDLAHAMHVSEGLTHIPVVLLTGAYVDEKDESRRLFAKVLQKPVSAVALLSAVATLLGVAKP